MKDKITAKVQKKYTLLYSNCHTSRADIHEEAAPEGAFKSDVCDCSFVVKKSTAPKCERCWHYEAEVSADPEYPGLCPRCIENIKGSGEKRLFA